MKKGRNNKAKAVLIFRLLEVEISKNSEKREIHEKKLRDVLI